MPLNTGQFRLQAVEKQGCPPRFGQDDRQNAHFWFIDNADGSTETLGQQLMAEAKTEKGLSAPDDGIADKSLFVREPGKLPFLPDLHRATQGTDAVDIADIRDGFTLVERNHLNAHAVVCQQRLKSAEMFRRVVLEHKQLEASGQSFGQFRPPWY